MKRFPMQAACAALLVYLVTLSHGVTTGSLAFTAKVAGWDWLPMTGQPLLWLLTLPFRVLPASWVPLTLNLFAVVQAAVTIGLLARILELLDWDCPLASLPDWCARLPLILACVVCGLEFNFWQQATAMTGEMLQLLLFATAIWCLLEYRRTAAFRWLQAATFVWGLGMAENWMMQITLPLFVVTLFWFGKFRIFSTKIIGRLVVTGLVGFSALALMPLVNGLSLHSPLSFGEAWIASWKSFKNVLAVIYYNFWRAHRLAFVAVIIFYLVPVLTLMFRPRDEGTQNKSGVDQFQSWIHHGLLAVVLLACVWLQFNPAVGPQQIVAKQVSLTLPFLSLGYLLAICAGYLAGNLMLAFLAKPTDGYRRPSAIANRLRGVTVSMFSALLVIVTAGLIFRNAPAVTLANRLPLEQFGKLAMQNLPVKGGIVLSDDPIQLLSFEAVAAHAGSKWLAVDTRSLALPAYRHWLAANNPGCQLPSPATNLLNPPDILHFVAQLTKSNQVYYLHPSFGNLFEAVYAEPEGLAYGLKIYTDRSVNPPSLTTNAIARTEKFWADAGPLSEMIQHTLPSPKHHRLSPLESLYARLHLQPAPVTQGQLLGEWLSLAANDWGVQLQRAGQLETAKVRFTQAFALNPNNVSAKINLDCNSNLIAKGSMNLSGVETITSQLGTLPRMSLFLASNGAIDEPSFCFVLGGIFLKANMPRQSLQQFERANTLAPSVVAPKLALAELYGRLGFAEKARDFINQARNEIAKLPQKGDLEAGLSLLEAGSWLAQSNAVNASSVLQNLLHSDPDNPRTQSMALRGFLSLGDYTNAVAIVDRQLAANPDDLTALANRAVIQLKQGAYTNGVQTLNHILTLTNATDVRLLRNGALIEIGQLDTAEKDYLELRTTIENPAAVDFNLSEIALRRCDTNRAIELLERCLTNVTEGTVQFQVVTNRLHTLKHP